MRQIWIVGPTASGKTNLSIKLSKIIDFPIINCDSRQFWKDIKLITCSPTEEEIKAAPHLLFNILKADEKPDLGWWSRSIKALNKPQYILVGGTIFYGFNLMRGIPILDHPTPEIAGTWQDLNNINSDIASKIHPNDTYRVQRALNFYSQYQCDFSDIKDKIQQDLLVIALYPEKEFLQNNIQKRITSNIDLWIEEVRSNQHDNYRNIIGYQECLEYLNNNINKDQLISNIFMSTMRYAKRQIKFMKKLTPEISITFNQNNYEEMFNEVIGKIQDKI